jgi:hypothetical protein
MQTNNLFKINFNYISKHDTSSIGPNVMGSECTDG